jgi:hypothetical protein
MKILIYLILLNAFATIPSFADSDYDFALNLAKNNQLQGASKYGSCYFEFVEANNPQDCAYMVTSGYSDIGIFSYRAYCFYKGYLDSMVQLDRSSGLLTYPTASKEGDHINDLTQIIFDPQTLKVVAFKWSHGTQSQGECH